MAIPQELLLVHYVPQELFWFNCVVPNGCSSQGKDHWECNVPKKTQINNIKSFSFVHSIPNVGTMVVS
jgi:hypothetical protein